MNRRSKRLAIRSWVAKQLGYPCAQCKHAASSLKNSRELFANEKNMNLLQYFIQIKFNLFERACNLLAQLVGRKSFRSRPEVASINFTLTRILNRWKTLRDFWEMFCRSRGNLSVGWITQLSLKSSHGIRLISCSDRFHVFDIGASFFLSRLNVFSPTLAFVLSAAAVSPAKEAPRRIINLNLRQAFFGACLLYLFNWLTFKSERRWHRRKTAFLFVSHSPSMHLATIKLLL
jgi:hypothetical protein